MNRSGLAVALGAVAVVTVASCSSVEPAPTPSPKQETIPSADMSDTGPGSLIEATRISTFDTAVAGLGGTVARAAYRSTSGVDGSPTVVSAALFVPPGTPPVGGWPVIAFAHGTSGIRTECAPSESRDLLGSSSLVRSYLELGFAVAAPDYQGLGSEGYHPYLDNTTAGLNVIDSVRALRKLSDDVSPRWAAFGGSQGGGATWAANEQSSSYATDLELVGTVSLVPSANMSGLVAKAVEGTLSPEQLAAYIWILMGIEKAAPEMNRDDYVSGVVRENWDVLSACQGAEGEERGEVLSQAGPDDVRPVSDAAAAWMTQRLTDMAVADNRAAAPMNVIYGGQDEFIDPQWTAEAIAKACSDGDVVQWELQPDKGHGTVDGSASVQWLGERFAGLPAPSNC